MKNVYDDPSYAELRAALEQELRRQRVHYEVTGAADRAYDELLEARRSRRKR